MASAPKTYSIKTPEAKSEPAFRNIDKIWSFTDCFSFITIRDLLLREALSKDAHFRAAGFIPLLT